MGLRETLLAKSGATEVVEFEIEGEKYKFRKPTVGQRGKVYELAGLDAGDPKHMKVNISKLQAAALIETLIDENGAKVYSDTDFEELLNSRAGSTNDKLAAKAATLLTEAEAGKS